MNLWVQDFFFKKKIGEISYTCIAIYYPKI